MSAEREVTVESNLRRLSVGAVVVFAVVLVAFFWVERRLAANLSRNDEIVVPAREVAVAVKDALGELLVRQSQIAGARSLDDVNEKLDRSGPEEKLAAARARVGEVAAQLVASSGDALEPGYPERFAATFDQFLDADDRFAQANLESQRLAEELDLAIRSVERDLKTFLESANGISGKMRFAYGSALRRIKRDLRSGGWSARVQDAVKREVLASSSRRNMIVGDVLGLASEMNRLAGKIGLVINDDQLRSLYANELVPTRDRLEVSLDELRYEVQGEKDLEGIAASLSESLAGLSQRVLAKDVPESLMSLKARRLAAERESARVQGELSETAKAATEMTRALVSAAEAQGRSFADALRAAGQAARTALFAVVALALVGGLLGVRAVRASLARLRATNEHLSRLKDELTEMNEGLEAKVMERTAALDQRNRAMRVVLDNVEQGLATFSRDGTVETERSARFDDWFGARAGGRRFAAVLTDRDPKLGSYFELAWNEVLEGIMPLEVTLEQLPRRFACGGRTLALDYRAVELGADGVPARTLVVATDITEQLERQRAEAAQREFAQIFHHLMRDRASFLDFFEEAEAIVRRLEEPQEGSDQELFRAVHTLKGNCALFGLERMAELSHEVESAMIDGGRRPREDEIEEIRAVWGDTSRRIRRLLQTGTDTEARVTHAELSTVTDELRRLDVPPWLLERLESWHHEPVGARLERLGDQARGLAQRLGKGDIEVTTRGREIRLPREPLAGFWTSLAHVIRNAIDHGLEEPDARTAAGKGPRGLLEIAVEQDANEARILVSDDGAGIDWERIRVKAAAAGLPHYGRDDLVAALFADGLSSRDEVSQVSGRGVGMAAVRSAIARLGARVEVTSARGEGTTFTFRIPRGSLLVVPLTDRSDKVTGTLDLASP